MSSKLKLRNLIFLFIIDSVIGTVLIREHCEPLGSIDNGGHEYSSLLCRMRYTCNPGYQLVGPQDLFFIDGEWSSTKPSCVAVTCPTLTPPLHGSFEFTDDIFPQYLMFSSVKFSCDEDYRLDRNDETARCLSTGEWSQQTPECIDIIDLITCPMVQLPDHGLTLSCTNDFRYGSVCTVTCDDGYKLAVEQSSQCLRDTDVEMAGRWEPELSICIDIDECEEHGETFMCGVGGQCGNTEGSYICICHSGYSQRGDDHECRDIDECDITDICGPGGTCDNQMGSYMCVCAEGYQGGGDETPCTLEVCRSTDRFGNFPNGTVKCEENEGVVFCVFECNEDFDLIGESVFNCSYEDNRWTDQPLPTCRANNNTGECEVDFKLDLMIVVDESGSIGLENYQLTKQFINRTVAHFARNIDSGIIRIGVITFATSFTAQIPMHAAAFEDISAEIMELKYQPGGTNMGAAIDYAQAQLVNRTDNDPERHELLLLVTDGVASDDPGPPAEEARSLGIHFIAVGVGRSNWRQLEQIVGNNELVFKARTFTDLLNMSDTISDAVCDEVSKSHQNRTQE